MPVRYTWRVAESTCQAITPSKKFLRLTQEVHVICKVVGKDFVILINPHEVSVVTVWVKTVHVIVGGRVLDLIAIIGIGVLTYRLFR